jgi:hypothetical protein
MRWLLALMITVSLAAQAKKLTKIEIQVDPVDQFQGYHITGGSATLHLNSICHFDDGSTESPCSSISPTWGSGNVSAANVAPTTGPSTVVTSTGSPGSVTFEIYAYDTTAGLVIGHHPMDTKSTPPGALASRPETSSANIIVGATVVVSAGDSGNSKYFGDYCYWSSSNPAVASTDTWGRVTGISPGTANIVCNYFGMNVSRTVDVINPAVPSNTWYVRADGGPRYYSGLAGDSCTGLTNAAMVVGGGPSQSCAFNHPMYLVTDNHPGAVVPPGAIVDCCVAMQAGDTAYIAPNTARSDGVWQIGKYMPGTTTPWTGLIAAYSLTPPSGVAAQHTRIIGTGYVPGTYNPSNVPGNRTRLQGYFGSAVLSLYDVQYFDLDGIDIGNSDDCIKANAFSGAYDYLCPTTSPGTAEGNRGDDFTANVTYNDVRIHGFIAGWAGTPGPGLVWNHSSSQYNVLTGLNFDNPYGWVGNRAGGFTGNYVTITGSGCTEEMPKPLSAVSRSSNTVAVTFAPGAIVNYEPGTNVILSGMTPTDLNGTFPVNAVSFNQQTVNITGGTCPANGTGTALHECDFTTTTQPTFGKYAFVQISGVSPSYLNGGWEVWSSSPSGFVIITTFKMSGIPSHSTIPITSSGGIAATANSVTFAQGGADEIATGMGTATHVVPAHHCYDQDAGTYANGDGVGTGSDTIGSWICDHCTIKDNWQDGWDMLHSAMEYSQFTNTISTGNQGAPAKFGNTDVGLFANNMLVANCASHLAFNADWPPDYNQMTSMICRAGDTFPSQERPWSQMVITNNTWDTTQSVGFDDRCTDLIGCRGPLAALGKFEMQNNLWIGFQDTNDNDPTTTPGYGACYASGTCPIWTYTNNAQYQIRNFPAGQLTLSPPQPGVNSYIPNILSRADETKAWTFNMLLPPGSNLSGVGVLNADVPATDMNGNSRSVGGGNPSVGAFEQGAPVVYTQILNPVGSGTITGCGGPYFFNQTYSCALHPGAGTFLSQVTGCGGTLTGLLYVGRITAGCTVTAVFSPLPGSTWTGLNLSGFQVQ